MIHKLKILPSHFSAVKDGRKKFEVRKNDRFYKEGDEVLLEEFVPQSYWDPEDPKSDEYSGEFLHRKITYILRGGQFGIEAGYVVLGLSKI